MIRGYPVTELVTNTYDNDAVKKAWNAKSLQFEQCHKRHRLCDGESSRGEHKCMLRYHRGRLVDSRRWE